MQQLQVPRHFFYACNSDFDFRTGNQIVQMHFLTQASAFLTPMGLNVGKHIENVLHIFYTLFNFEPRLMSSAISPPPYIHVRLCSTFACLRPGTLFRQYSSFTYHRHSLCYDFPSRLALVVLPNTSEFNC